MERKERHFYFFKAMTPGCFEQKLKLPPKISKEVEKQKSRSASVGSRLGTWNMSMCRNNSVICLDEGWPEFVDRHALRVGDILYFALTMDDQYLHFKVYVFDPSCCEKDFPKNTTPTPTPTSSKTILKSCQEEEEEEDGMTYFEKKMVPYYASKMAKINIPVTFMRRNKLIGLERKQVSLKDPKGREWCVKVTRETKGSRLSMYGKTWHDFYAANNLKDGDTCLFQLPSSSTTFFLHVHISRAP